MEEENVRPIGKRHDLSSAYERTPLSLAQGRMLMSVVDDFPLSSAHTRVILADFWQATLVLYSIFTT
jgi:hypothetical protein